MTQRRFVLWAMLALVVGMVIGVLISDTFLLPTPEPKAKVQARIWPLADTLTPVDRAIPYRSPK